MDAEPDQQELTVGARHSGPHILRLNLPGGFRLPTTAKCLCATSVPVHLTMCIAKQIPRPLSERISLSLRLLASVLGLEGNPLTSFCIASLSLRQNPRASRWSSGTFIGKFTSSLPLKEPGQTSFEASTSSGETCRRHSAACRSGALPTHKV